MRSAPNPLRLGGVLAALAAGLLLSAPSASASDTFGLDNDSKVATLSGYSLWGKGNTINAECRTGPFPGPTENQFFFNPGDSGSITLSQNPFSKCPHFINPLTQNDITSPYLSAGTWFWIADDPFIGYAHLTCQTVGQYGSQLIYAQVDGLTCTFADSTGASAGSFTSSAVPIRDGDGVALVQHFPSSAATPNADSARYEIVIRRKGDVHGREQETLVSGRARKVEVDLSRELRERVAEKGFVKVKAILRRVDGAAGSGHRTTLTVGEDQSSLPF